MEDSASRSRVNDNQGLVWLVSSSQSRPVAHCIIGTYHCTTQAVWDAIEPLIGACQVFISPAGERAKAKEMHQQATKQGHVCPDFLITDHALRGKYTILALDDATAHQPKRQEKDAAPPTPPEDVLDSVWCERLDEVQTWCADPDQISQMWLSGDPKNRFGTMRQVLDQVKPWLFSERERKWLERRFEWEGKRCTLVEILQQSKVPGCIFAPYQHCVGDDGIVAKLLMSFSGKVVRMAIPDVLAEIKNPRPRMPP